jgi:hypothetical protein
MSHLYKHIISVLQVECNVDQLAFADCNKTRRQFIIHNYTILSIHYMIARIPSSVVLLLVIVACNRGIQCHLCATGSYER